MTAAEESLHGLIEKVAKDLKFDNYEIKLKRVSSGGANYTSELFVSTISAPGRENIELFAKVGIITEEMRSKIQIDQVYDAERNFYTELLKIYERLQEEHGVPDEHRLVTPKYYASSDKIYEETLLLENMQAKGFIMYDRMKSVHWDYAAKSIEELAKFHALSFAHGEKNAEEFQRILNEKKSIYIDGKNGEYMKSMFEKMFENALKVVEMKYKNKFYNFVSEKVLKIFEDYFKPLKRPIVIHGDYRHSNLMHKINEEGDLQITILDYQTLYAGCPVSDLLYFIFNCSDEEFRAKYFDKLVEHYYSQLCLALRRLHVDPEKVYPREDFDYEFEKLLPFGLLVAVFTLQIVTVEAADAPDIGAGEYEVKTSDLYSERLNGIVNDYVKWGII